MNNEQKGFTLIEIMIAVAIIAIIAAIAFPAYNDQVRRGRRAEAMSQLQDIALQQERWRATNTTYATAAQLSVNTTGNYYNYTVPVNTTSAFTVRAVATGDQTNDTGCTTIEINQNGDRTPAGCW